MLDRFSNVTAFWSNINQHKQLARYRNAWNSGYNKNCVKIQQKNKKQKQKNLSSHFTKT